VSAFASLQWRETRRADFVAKYARRNIADRMAADVLALKNIE
jgi:hypothetical protein